MNDLEITPQLRIPRRELQFTFVRSSGPGGQNVNKVNTKAQLRWPVAANTTLPEGVRQRFCAKYRRRISEQGDFLVTSQRYRDQARNVEDCLAKLTALIAAVAEPPKVRKRRQPSRTQREKRLREKRLVAEKKRERRPPGERDE